MRPLQSQHKRTRNSADLAAASILRAPSRASHDHHPLKTPAFFLMDALIAIY